MRPRTRGPSRIAAVFLEDIHWADDKSLDLVNHIIRAKRELRLLIVCLTRPALFERRTPLWMDQQEFHTRIELKPLSSQDTRTLITDILRKVDVIPEDLCDLIVVNAEGNPFYVEEIIKMLLDDGVILKNDGKWSVDSSRLTDLQNPTHTDGCLASPFGCAATCRTRSAATGLGCRAHLLGRRG